MNQKDEKNKHVKFSCLEKLDLVFTIIGGLVALVIFISKHL